MIPCGAKMRRCHKIYSYHCMHVLAKEVSDFPIYCISTYETITNNSKTHSKINTIHTM